MTIEEVKEKIQAYQYKGFHFDPGKHRYTLDGRYLPSATGILKKFVKPFDRDGIAERVAKKEGRTVAEVLAEWDGKGKFSADLGTEVHWLIEQYWLGNHPATTDEWITVSDEAKRRFAAFLDFRQKKLPNLVPIAPELRIFSRKYNGAGTIDLLAYNNRDGKVYIFDWKTNGKFRTDDERAFDRLLSPFDKYDDNEINNYSLQLSLYKLFLLEAGIEVNGSQLVWLPPGGMNAVMYTAKDFSKELSGVLKSNSNREVEF